MTMEFQDSKRYLVSGATLNRMARDAATNRIIAGEGIGIRRIPGTGTIVKLAARKNEPRWKLSPIAGGKVKISSPGLVKRTSALDASGLVTVAGLDGEFTPAADRLLVLEVLPTLETTLKLVSQWDGWPYPIDTVESDPPGFFVVEKYYYPLYDFVSETGDPEAVPLSGGLFAERRAEDSDLQFELGRLEDKAGHVVSAWVLRPSQGCRRT